MRILTPLAATLALLALPAAHAQASDSCTQASPCLWDVVVDRPGFIGEPSYNWTVGDWMTLDVSNDDNATHTVTLSGYSIQLTVPSLGEKTQVVQLTQAGAFQLADAPSGGTIPVTVVNGDVVDYQNGLINANGKALTSAAGTGSAAHTPSLGLPLLVGALIAVAATRRRAA